jgi:signal transduction histidine kinase/ActR/RegA family two-component response regulator
MRVGYDLDQTTSSLIISILGLAAGTFVAASRPTLAGRLTGGAIVGLGIAAMHFLGVRAMILPAIIVWDPGLVGAALVTVMLGACSTFWTIGDGASRFRLGLGAALLVFSICGLHFTAMSAITLIPDAAAISDSVPLDPVSLALQVGAMAGFVVLSAVVMLAMASFTSRSTLRSLQAALDGAPSALAFFDRRRRLMFWNKGYAEILAAYGVEAASGRDFLDILKGATAGGLPYAIHDDALTQVAQAKPATLQEFTLPSGRTHRAQFGPLKDGGFTIVTFDVTAERETERLANEARDKAVAASQLKSAFLANMSHEIRTPLNGVLGMTQVMERHRLDPDQRDRLDLIRTSGEALLAILNDILDLSKIESGRLELEDSPFDIAETVAPACEAFATLARQKDVMFTLTIDPDAAGTWQGDALRLRQIVWNLVSNAVKFTANGEVTVKVSSVAGAMRIAVRDTGIGVSAERLPSLFGKFIQADSSTTRRFGGSGLGLSIANDLARLMGGEITAQSIEGQGSVFTLDAPLRRGRPSDRAAPRGGDRQAPAGRLRILAAEDNATNRLILAALLEPMDIDLVIAHDGVEALAAFKGGAFDVILMDAQMPNMDGPEATREIRKWEAVRHAARTPILALSANVMTHQIEEYMTAGMDGFIAKPIQVENLFAALDRVLADHQAGEWAA